MSTADILSLISLISFIIAGVCLVLAIVFWFAFSIPKVIGDLSGATARKSIAKTRAINEHAGGKGYGPSKTNLNRGKLTSTMESTGGKKKAVTGQPVKKETEDKPHEHVTEVLAANHAHETQSSQTELLSPTEEVGIGSEETALLLDSTPIPAPQSDNGPFKMLTDIMLIHTDEII